MRPTDVSDELLLAGSDPADFEEFYTRHVDTLLGFFARRTRDAELAADLTAETFAAALAARRRYRPQQGAALAWFLGIAAKKLADAQRRGYAEQRCRRRLGMERIELTDADIARIDALGESTTASALVESLQADQREAIRAHVLDERSYAEIAVETEVSEAVIRKRVSRGLATVRARMGARR
jgi:RNA polymerase sigma-70 factor (ECF subfamily)